MAAVAAAAASRLLEQQREKNQYKLPRRKWH